MDAWLVLTTSCTSPTGISLARPALRLKVISKSGSLIRRVYSNHLEKARYLSRKSLTNSISKGFTIAIRGVGLSESAVCKQRQYLIWILIHSWTTFAAVGDATGSSIFSGAWPIKTFMTASAEFEIEDRLYPPYNLYKNLSNSGDWCLTSKQTAILPFAKLINI